MEKHPLCHDPKKAETDFAILDSLIPYTTGRLVTYLDIAIQHGLITEEEKHNIMRRFL